jgi:tetratricopeptide (TPR) repeat protein
MSKQRDVLEALVRNYNGPHTKGLTRLVANWTTYVGWLHTACREYSDADSLFAKAESMADEIDDGILASTATSYRGYLSLLQGHHRAALRSTMAALGTPGAHSTQIAYDMLQAAQAYAGLGDNKEASRLLHEASDIVSNAGAPPESIYWYTEPFLRMNIGLAQHSIGRYRDAVDSISSGLAELPVGQRQAEWLDEYQQALEYSSVNADQQD